MSTPPPVRKAPRAHAPVKDRRGAVVSQGTPGSLRRLKGLMGRPMRLERRDGHLHVVLVDRRIALAADQSPLRLAALRTELRSHLLADESDSAVRVLGDLFVVYKELGRTGWLGVGALPSELLARALAQAEMLVGEAASPLLEELVLQLQRLQVAADRREARDARLTDSAFGGDLEVSEATHEEFEAMERSWVGSSPSILVDGDR